MTSELLLAKTREVDSILEDAKKIIEERTGLQIQISVAYDVKELDSFMQAEVDKLIESMCACWGITFYYINTKNREQHRVAMRGCCYYAIRKMFPAFTVVSIGKIFNTDHTTVLHSLNSVRNWLETEDAFFLVYYKPVKHLLDEVEVK